MRSKGMYLAVLPAYRQECITQVLRTDPTVSLYCSTRHLDPTVKTGIRPEQYRQVRMVRIAGRAFLQLGYWRQALAIDDLVLDMNPRSLTAWAMLIARRSGDRRTLVWGHFHPQAGAGSKRDVLRRLMRRLSSGVITYTYSDLGDASSENPTKPAWVAPNSLYRRDEILGSAKSGRDRIDFVYVGRFEPAKKVGVAVEAFACSGLASEGARLVLVGDGSETDALRKLATRLGVDASVLFPGWIGERTGLANIYGSAVASLCPGFAGLGLTQSLGFGVSMIVSRDEPHSPEIELAEAGGVLWFDSDSPRSLADQMILAWARRDLVPNTSYSETVAEKYSAEAMAEGLLKALNGEKN